MYSGANNRPDEDEEPDRQDQDEHLRQNSYDVFDQNLDFLAVVRRL